MNLKFNKYLKNTEDWKTYNEAKLPNWMQQAQYEGIICQIFEVLDGHKSPLKCYFLVKISLDNYILYSDSKQNQNIIEKFYQFIIPIIQANFETQSSEANWFRSKISQYTDKSIIFPQLVSIVQDIFQKWDEELQIFLNQYSIDQKERIVMAIAMTSTNTLNLSPFSIAYASILSYYSLTNNSKLEQLWHEKIIMNQSFQNKIIKIQSFLKDVL